MPVQTVLIQEQEVINGGGLKASPLPARFDALLLTAHIKTAMDRHVRDFIGEDFYNALVSEKGTTVSNYNADLGAIVPAFTTPAYETLWKEYLLEFCSNAVVYESLLYIGLQMGSNGIYTNSTEYGENVGLEGVNAIKDDLLERIKLNKKYLQRYLCANSDTYTLYDSATNCDECKEEDKGDFLGFILY